MTPGLAIGFGSKLNNVVSWGIELDARMQLDKMQFKAMEDVSETLLLDTGIMGFEIKNKFKVGLSGVLSFMNSFYLKAGPSFLRQSVDFSLAESNTLAKVKYSDDKDLLGVTAGAGYIFKVNRNFGIFTEYNYSYYPRKSLSSYAVGNAEFANIPAGNFESHSGKLKIAQSEFFLGVVYSTNLM